MKNLLQIILSILQKISKNIIIKETNKEILPKTSTQEITTKEERENQPHRESIRFQDKYIIIPRYLTSPSKRRSGIFISPAVKFIVVHDTGNPNSTAANNVNYFKNTENKEEVSAHLFVDDKEIIECIPALTSNKPEKAWHVFYGKQKDNELFGYNANDAAIAVEYCYGDNINADEAYRKYIWTVAYACRKFNIDPKSSIVGHHILDPERKTDPTTGLKHSGRTYEQLLKDIVTEYDNYVGIT